MQKRVQSYPECAEGFPNAQSQSLNVQRPPWTHSAKPPDVQKGSHNPRDPPKYGTNPLKFQIGQNFIQSSPKPQRRRIFGGGAKFGPNVRIDCE